MHVYINACHTKLSFLRGVVLELPTMDDGDGGTLPDPLEHPPDVAKVGADLRAAATSRQEAPTGM